MKFWKTKLGAAILAISVFAGLKEPPIEGNKLNFSPEDLEKIKGALKDGQDLNALIEAANKEIEKELKAGEFLQGLDAKLEEAFAELEIPKAKLEELAQKAKTDNPDDPSAMLNALTESIKSFKADFEEKLRILGKKPEDDSPENIIKGIEALKHSKTHLFASGLDFDAIGEERPWNLAAANGSIASATTYGEATIKQLNKDIADYVQQNPTFIRDLHKDNFQLPDFWPKRLNVDDRVADGHIVTGEITQGRKLGWLPKNVQELEAETGQIYPIQIDAKWSGYDLQKIETNWLNFMNTGAGSSPYKMRFVEFLITKLMERARLEDRIATVKGIFVKTPDDAQEPGKFINRQNGVFYLAWYHRFVTKKYRAFSMTEITPNNVYDWFHQNDDSGKGFLYRLPEEARNSTNLVTYVHSEVWTWYKAKYKMLNGSNMDYKGKPEHFEDFPNIRVEVLHDHANKQFVLCTDDTNIEILENIPSEKTSYELQKQGRDILLMGDYKLGVRFVVVGKEYDINKPEAFNVQAVWSNDASPLANDTFIPLFNEASGIYNLTYKDVQVHASLTADIESIKGLPAGTVIRIKGNTAVAAGKVVKHNASKIKLAGNADFSLKDGGTLTLLMNADGTLSELKRTTVPDVAPTSVVFQDTSIEADLGFDFTYKGASAATLSTITGGVNGKTITIYGSDGGDLTVQNISGLVSVGTAVVLTDASKYLKLTKVDGMWYKVESN